MKKPLLPGTKYSFFAIKYVAIAVMGSAAVLLTACSKPPPPPEPVRAVKVLTVGEAGLVAGIEYAGEVRARVESRLGFRVGGKLIKRQAEVGQRVRAGQVLAQLDPQDFKLASDGARAAVAAATTNRDLAAADFKRFQSLKEQNFISGAELERRETALKAAQAQLDQAQSQLANSGNQVRYANLVADMNGVITAIEAEPGQVVSQGASVVRIAQDGPRDVVFSVPEDKLTSLSVGQAVKVKRWSSDASNSEEGQGKLREIAASADPLTRTYQAKLTLDATSNWPLGATVYVLAPGLAQGVQAIKLPTSSLMQSAQGQTQVWLLDTTSMTVKPTSVQVVTADGNEAVIGSGIKAGDVIVATGAHVLAPGQKVSIYAEKGQKPSLPGKKSSVLATELIAKESASRSAGTTPSAAK
jgi:membrane fusion protein, multidrug efflux system